MLESFPWYNLVVDSSLRICFAGLEKRGALLIDLVRLREANIEMKVFAESSGFDIIYRVKH